MFDDETTRIRRQQKFLQDVERSITDANRRIIHARIDQLSRASFVALATRVAELRAAYLETALTMAVEQGDFADLAARRMAYEETKAAFAALERAIERGYVDIDSGT